MRGFFGGTNVVGVEGGWTLPEGLGDPVQLLAGEVAGGDPFTGHEQSQMHSTTDMHGGELWEWLRWDREEITFCAWGSWKSGEKDKQKENKVLYTKFTVKHDCVATGNCKNQTKEENEGNKISLWSLFKCMP